MGKVVSRRLLAGSGAWGLRPPFQVWVESAARGRGPRTGRGTRGLGAPAAGFAVWGLAACSTATATQNRRPLPHQAPPDTTAVRLREGTEAAAGGSGFGAQNDLPPAPHLAAGKDHHGVALVGAEPLDALDDPRVCAGERLDLVKVPLGLPGGLVWAGREGGARVTRACAGLRVLVEAGACLVEQWAGACSCVRARVVPKFWCVPLEHARKTTPSSPRLTAAKPVQARPRPTPSRFGPPPPRARPPPRRA